jgi:tRNA U34 5-methylaminomethyl-2-thiouridine-forming methyltransferase MnmC
MDLAVQSGLRADFWFHDPFGYDVNPEGYSEEMLRKCRIFFKSDTLACTYACNKFFQSVLEKTKFKFDVLPSGDPLLKRERLIFRI